MAMVTQDVATVMSSLGAVVTIASTISGCILGSEAGVLPGCAGGYAAGYVFHQGVTNPLETVLSAASLGATIWSDVLTQDTRINSWDVRRWAVGEDTKTSAATFAAGTIITEPIIDAGIDIYASGYNHGAFCGISTVLYCLGNSLSN
jgi:hypothetical protein